MPESCRRCGGSKLFAGSFRAQKADFMFVPVPPNQGFAAPGVGFREQPHACLDCGFVELAIDAPALRRVVLQHGDELARQHLAALDHGPCYVLPDTDLAREVAAKVAELDALARQGKPVAGRYREWRGIPWDEAIRDTAGWRDLSRDAKLARFGWEPKKGPEGDEFF